MMWGYGPNFGMMGNWGGYSGGGPISMIITIIVLAVIIARQCGSSAPWRIRTTSCL